MTLAWLSICITVACGRTFLTEASASTFCRIETRAEEPALSSASKLFLSLSGRVSKAMPST